MSTRSQFLLKVIGLFCILYVARDLLWRPRCLSYKYPGCPACVNDVLQLSDITHLDENAFKDWFGEKVIFFLETSGQATIRPRQVCSIESFSRLHKNYKILVVFLKPVSEISMSANKALSSVMRSSSNIQLVTVDPHEIFKGTKFEKIVSDASSGQYRLEHISDFLRLVLLWLFGGVYADLDLVALESMEDFFAEHPNFVTPETSTEVNNCFLGFQRENAVLRRVIEALRDRYNASEYLGGPRAIKDAIEKMTSDKVEASIGRESVGSLRIPSYKFASPVSSSDYKSLFEEDVDTDDLWKKLADSSACHFWSHQSRDMMVYTNSTSAYAHIARQFCPRAFWSCDFSFY